MQDREEKPRDSQAEVASDRVIENLAAENPKLSLARLGIAAMPEALIASSRMPHIKVLDLKHNKLQLIPSELFLCLTHLQEFDISKNRLSYLPETIGLATGLRKLNLRGNVLQSVPDGICLLHALEVLDIAQNCLERLPTAVGGWKNLQRLDLAGNRLEEIPHKMGLIVGLEHVDISGNPIQEMPLAIERLQTKGEILRSKARRQKLVRRALHVRGSVRAAFVDECLQSGS